VVPRRFSYTILKNNPGTFFGEPFYDWRGHICLELARHLRARGTAVAVEEEQVFEVRIDPSVTAAIPVRDSLAIVQCDQTGEYSVLDFHDWIVTADLDLLVRDARCRRILKCQYRTGALARPGYEKVRPWTYFDRFWPEHEARLVAARGVPRTSDALYFRGADWAERGPALDELSRRGVIGPEFGIVGFEQYFRESAPHRIMLSLPGMADVCNRDIECFGRGTCVLRPRIRNRFHNDLVPDHHYISVDVDVRTTDPLEVADRVERRFREVAGDHAYLAAVARHAARWFDDNVRVDAAMTLTAELLGLATEERAEMPGVPSRRHLADVAEDRRIE
jgi:hypothetical protein